MGHWLPFWPRTAAVGAVAVNDIYVAELLLCAVILLTVVAMMLTFCVRYARGSSAARDGRVRKTWHWEIGWTAATFIVFLVLFVWGAVVYVWLYKSPPGDIEIYVVGKQWMWKIEHPGGQREIDTLHVPVGRTVRLVMTSEDVIHSFYVPAFRLKHDVVPGTYETIWFKATKPGRYLLECSEFCGAEHAAMKGHVVVMTPADYAKWLAARGPGQTLAQQGQALFRRFGCSGCHTAGSTVHAPTLNGLYGSFVQLQDGTAVKADDRYIRDCVLNPRSFTVAGYPPVMPDFSGRIDEEQLIRLIAYIQSLK